MSGLTKAFTLAEVLITLMIIGVIASVTIPGLINSTNDAEYRVAFKKAYGDLSQGLKRASLDGTIKGRCNGDHICFRNIFLPNLSYIKTCDAPNNANCFASNSLTSGWQNGASVVLSNGISILFYSYDSACTGNQTGIFPGQGACGEALIDINGYTKGPNNGKDIYWVEFTENNLRSNQGILDLLSN
jgi:prepilin-type N-terminal cleavage/methylation domain-containing protein